LGTHFRVQRLLIGLLACLVLIFFNCLDGSVNAGLVEFAQLFYQHNASLVAEYGPAEMSYLIEDDEADDADENVEDTGRHEEPHPCPDGSEMWLVDWVEALQTLNGYLHVDVAHPGVDHPEDNDDERDEHLDDAVNQMNVFQLVDESHPQRFLHQSINQSNWDF